MRKHYHFDDILNAMMNMVIMSQTVNWAPMMFSIVNSGGPEAVPIYNNSPFVAFWGRYFCDLLTMCLRLFFTFWKC